MGRTLGWLEMFGLSRCEENKVEAPESLTFFEFIVNKNGKNMRGKEKNISHLRKDFPQYLKEYHAEKLQPCLYQVTTTKECPEDHRHCWNLWAQFYARDGIQAKEILDKLRVGIRNGKLPPSGYLRLDGCFWKAAHFDNEIMRTHDKTYKLILIFRQYGLDPRLGAEIGVQDARNAQPLLRRLPRLKLIAVDNYDPAGETVRISMEEHKQNAVRRLLNYKNRVRWIFKPSVEAAKEVKDEYLDFVYIDALHDYDHVKEDINAWVPKVRSGGLVIGHDYTPTYRGLRKAVWEEFGTNFDANGDVWFTQK